MKKPPRFYLPDINPDRDYCTLPAASWHYATRVLRLKTNAELILFDGQGNEYFTRLGADQRAVITKHRLHTKNQQSITLAVAIISANRMDMVLRAAVELGVSQIIPLITARSAPMAKRDRQKSQHWQGVIHASCEQSGRTYMPTLRPPTPLISWITQTTDQEVLLLSLETTTLLSSWLGKTSAPHKILCVGPEGDFTAEEYASMTAANFQSYSLGDTILRTETAVVSGLSIINCLSQQPAP